MRKSIDQDWTISARLRGGRRIEFKGLTAEQALAAHRRLNGNVPPLQPLSKDMARVAWMLAILDNADIEGVTIEGPQGDEVLKSLAPATQLG